MRQVIDNILCGLALAPVLAIIGYCFLAEDPVLVEIGRAAEAEARPYVLERQRECAADILRPIYARGEPTPEQVEAAYRDCE